MIRMGDPSGPMTLDKIGRLLRELQADVRQNRRDVEAMLPVITALTRQFRRTDRHIAELRDDVELMIRAELMSGAGRSGTCMERGLNERSDRVGRGETE